MRLVIVVIIVGPWDFSFELVSKRAELSINIHREKGSALSPVHLRNDRNTVLRVASSPRLEYNNK